MFRKLCRNCGLRSGCPDGDLFALRCSLARARRPKNVVQPPVGSPFPKTKTMPRMRSRSQSRSSHLPLLRRRFAGKKAGRSDRGDYFRHNRPSDPFCIVAFFFGPRTPSPDLPESEQQYCTILDQHRADAAKKASDYPDSSSNGLRLQMWQNADRDLLQNFNDTAQIFYRACDI